MRRAVGILSLIVCGLFALVGCNLPKPAPTNLSQADVVNTAAAQTVIALSTELAAGKNPTLGPLPTDEATSTPQPGKTSADASATPQGIASVNPSGSNTPTPPKGSPSATLDPSIPCNRASFLRDITIPDGSTLPSNTPFTKVWELKNTGSCAWTGAYQVIFNGGERMKGAESSPLLKSGEVKPGETVRVAVDLRAPDKDGKYKGSWRLQAADGTDFGIGEKALGNVFVDIEVTDFYSFADQTCSAEWSTNLGKLDCPMKDTSAPGSFAQLTDPTLETGKKETGAGLLVVPPASPDGYIVARYPPVRVPAQADFRAVIGCEPNSPQCYVKFKVTYTIDNGAEQLLGEWNEGFDSNTNQAIKDLNALRDKLVAFNLYVYVNGDPSSSRAIWFTPHLTR